MEDSTTPWVKAYYAQDIQAHVTTLPVARRNAVISQCGPAWKDIESRIPSDWISQDVFNPLTEAIRKSLGDDEMRLFYRKLSQKLSTHPMFQMAIEALVRITGMTPHTFLKFAPRARKSMIRNGGVLRYERIAKREARLHLSGFPISTWKTGTTALLLAGTWEGVIDSAQAVPCVEINDLNLENGSCVYHLSW